MRRGLAPAPMPEEHHGSEPPDRERADGAREPEQGLRTEFEFELPRGYVDAAGVVHKHGAMRLATARDELVPLHDDRVRENGAYLTVVLLGRVITRLGTITDVHAGMVVCEIGVAPVKPAEFVIFRLSQYSGGAALTE